MAGKELVLKKKKSLVKRQVTSPMDQASQFLKDGGNLENLEKMMELQERWEAGQARKAFHKDMVKAQSEMPVIGKDKENKQTNSKYSSHENIIRLAKPIYTDAGFSLMFYEGKTEKEGHTRIMVDIMHKSGHMETRFIDLELDNTGIKGSVNKTTIHAEGSTISYGRRYLTCMIFNIPTGDDNDGNSGNGAISKITELLDAIETVPDVEKFCRSGMKNNPGLKKELISLCAARKAVIVKEAMNADS